MTDYTSVYAKLARAEHHLVEFEEVLGAWIALAPLSLEGKMSPNGRTEELFVSLASKMPPELDLILGDCVHNLRSVLDHLAMAIAIANGTSVDCKSVYFPIYIDPNQYQQLGVKKIKKLSAPAQYFIETVQPYHRKGDSWVLTELSFLDNRDKHRALLSHEVTPLFGFAEPENLSYELAAPGMIKHGALYATITYHSNYEGAKNYRPPIHAGVTVDRSNGLGFLEVQPFLREKLLPHVRDVIVAVAESQFP